jgi:hypothetical protein
MGGPVVLVPALTFGTVHIVAAPFGSPATGYGKWRTF